MSIELKMNWSADNWPGRVGMSEKRREELNNKLAHARLDAKTPSDMIKAAAEMCDSVEELVLCAYAIGFKDGE